MALRRFSDNPLAGPLTGTEIIPGLQGGVDVQMSAQDIANLNVVAIPLVCSDETTPLTTGLNKFVIRLPFAMELLEVRASLTTAQATGSIFTVDINENGASILSTKLTIDNTEKTSTTATTPPVISDTALADDAEISVDIDQVGDGTATGLKVWLIGRAI